MNMKIDLDWKIKNLAGKEMEGDNEDPVHAGKIVAGLMVGVGSQNQSNPIKYFDWALKLYNKQPIEVDEADLEEIKKFVKEHQQIFIIVKAPLLRYLNELKQENQE
jgi:hypothetical protein